MTQPLKVLDAKPDDSSMVLRTHMVRKNRAPTDTVI